MNARASDFPALRSAGSRERLFVNARYTGAAEGINSSLNVSPTPRVFTAEHLDCEEALREALRQLHVEQKRRWPWWRRLLWP